MRRTKDGKPLAPYHLREHAVADRDPFWDGQARQLLNWAADCLESGQKIIDMHHRPSQETGSEPRLAYTPRENGTAGCSHCGNKLRDHIAITDGGVKNACPL